MPRRVTVSAEAQKAREWRKAHELEVRDLAELTGYSTQTIWGYERGYLTQSKPRYEKREIPAWVWRRWKMTCAGVDAQLKSDKKFDW